MLLKIRACFACRETGYRLMDFMKRCTRTANAQIEKGQRKKLKVQRHVFALTEKDVEVSNDGVSGTLSIFSKEPGATHLFISYAFACYIDMPAKPLDLHLSISTPMGDYILVDRVYKSCMISMCNREIFYGSLTHRDIWF